MEMSIDSGIQIAIEVNSIRTDIARYEISYSATWTSAEPKGHAGFASLIKGYRSALRSTDPLLGNMDDSGESMRSC
jgi:hypothetical protein